MYYKKPYEDALINPISLLEFNTFNNYEWFNLRINKKVFPSHNTKHYEWTNDAMHNGIIVDHIHSIILSNIAFDGDIYFFDTVELRNTFINNNNL